MIRAPERCIVFDCAGEACVAILHPAFEQVSDIGILIIVGGPQYRAGSHRQFVLLARQLAAAGYPVFRFDYRGMGDSEGEVRDFRFVADDLRAALNAMATSSGGCMRRIVIFGLCDAASAALMNASDDARVAGLILANPWVRTEAGFARAHVHHYYRARFFHRTFWNKILAGRLDLRQSLLSFFAAILKASGKFSRVSGPGEVDYVDQMREGLRGFTDPVLLILSGRDLTAKEFVSLCSNEPRWSRLVGRANVTQVSIHDADHTFSGGQAEHDLGRHCIDWLTSSVGGPRR